MAPLPHEYRVLLNLQAALAAIRVGDGFYYDVMGSAVKLDPNHDVDALTAENGPRPFVLIEMTEDLWDYARGDRPARPRIDLRAIVHWVSTSDPTRDADRLQTYLQGCADVEKALVADLQRGGLVIDTRILSRTNQQFVSGSEVWASIEIVMPLLRTFGEPSVTT